MRVLIAWPEIPPTTAAVGTRLARSTVSHAGTGQKPIYQWRKADTRETLTIVPQQADSRTAMHE